MKKKQIITLVILALILVVMGAAYFVLKGNTSAGTKDITVEVVNSEGESTKYELKTDAEYLADALDEIDGLTYEAEDSTYGLVYSSFNGETAVFEENGAYWAFYVNGDYCSFGASEQPIADGDAFQIAYTLAE